MKKRILIGISVMALLLTFGATSQAFAASSDDMTRVTGVISHDSKQIADAEVTVNCGTSTKTDVTDAGGSYLVSFAATDCPLGSVVQILAKKGELSGSASGDVTAVTTKLNTSVVNVSMPEYGVIAGGLAAVAGGAMIMFHRRRAQQADL